MAAYYPGKNKPLNGCCSESFFKCEWKMVFLSRNHASESVFSMFASKP